ncbi:hypothetical protein V6N13_121683 [Hibiscus sabdariffa]
MMATMDGEGNKRSRCTLRTCRSCCTGRDYGMLLGDGDVLDAFIARKKNMRGKRIRVSMARFKPRQEFWREVRPANIGTNKREASNENVKVDNAREEVDIKEKCGIISEEKVECSSKYSVKCKRITGIMETDDLLKFKRCLVGLMSTVCSEKSITVRLQEWGLSDIKIRNGAIGIFLFSRSQVLLEASGRLLKLSYGAAGLYDKATALGENCIANSRAVVEVGKERVEAKTRHSMKRNAFILDMLR